MHKKGFTLVEIMVVVAIIALLVTIAIPGLLRTRMMANETNAIATLKSIATAAETFRMAHGGMGTYPTALNDLIVTTPAYLTSFSGTTKAGYVFTLTGNGSVLFAAAAAPNIHQGVRFFCVDSTGKICASTAAIATTGGLCATGPGIVILGR